MKAGFSKARLSQKVSSEMFELETIAIKWPVYIPEPDDSLQQLAQAAIDEANGWAAGFPKVERFEIDLYVRSHNVTIGKRIERCFDGVVANWHLNCVPPLPGCEPCGTAVFVKGE